MLRRRCCPVCRDIEFSLDSMPVKRSASQGQTKTFTSALRFAQYELLRESLGLNPLLLLDDIFDKLIIFSIMAPRSRGSLRFIALWC